MPDPDTNTLRLRNRPRPMYAGKAPQAYAQTRARDAMRAGCHRATRAAWQRTKSGVVDPRDSCGDVIGFRRLEPDTLPVRCVSCAA